MKDLTVDKKQVELLRNLTGFTSIEIIWDINAFYFNTDSKTYKLECFDEKPEGSESKYDEIFYCQIISLEEKMEFEENNPKFWYKILSKDSRIKSIQYLNIIEQFPENLLVPIENESFKVGANKSTIGLIIETDKGFIPAFLLPSNYGFQWQPKHDFYSKSEVEILLENRIKHFEIINCA